MTIPTALDAAKLKKDIRKKNRKFGLADAIHLATAYENKATLITTDLDFRGVKGCSII